jgi:hypothetical protein
MDDQAELVWRKALRARGREWVMGELRRRVGQPDDPLYDVVFEEPLPTRDFCHRWCAEEENTIFRMSWHIPASIVALAIFLICCVKAVNSWDTSQSELARQMPATAATSTSSTSQTKMPKNSDNMPTNVPNPATQNAAGTSSGAKSLPSVCSYAVYDTAECNNSPYVQWSGSVNGTAQQQSQSAAPTVGTQSMGSALQTQSTNSTVQAQPMAAPALSQMSSAPASQSHH